MYIIFFDQFSWILTFKLTYTYYIQIHNTILFIYIRAQTRWKLLNIFYCTIECVRKKKFNEYYYLYRIYYREIPIWNSQRVCTVGEAAYLSLLRHCANSKQLAMFQNFVCGFGVRILGEDFARVRFSIGCICTNCVPAYRYATYMRIRDDQHLMISNSISKTRTEATVVQMYSSVSEYSLRLRWSPAFILNAKSVSTGCEQSFES